jgi:chromosome partitioning protein
MIVTVGNTKGGVGKSTLAVQIALTRARQGRDVWLVDADQQGTAQTAIGLRADAGHQPGVSCAQFVEAKLLRSQVARQAPKYQDVVIDAGGRDNAALRAALVLSDAVLVPFQPRSVDVWALASMAELVDEAQSVRPDLRAYAVLNGADPSPTSSDNTDAAVAAADYPQLIYLKTVIRRRKAFADATGLGLSIEERMPRDAKACAELFALVSILFTV